MLLLINLLMKLLVSWKKLSNNGKYLWKILISKENA
jgi:hypothetical protein